MNIHLKSSVSLGTVPGISQIAEIMCFSPYGRSLCGIGQPPQNSTPRKGCFGKPRWFGSFEFVKSLKSIFIGCNPSTEYGLLQYPMIICMRIKTYDHLYHWIGERSAVAILIWTSGCQRKMTEPYPYEAYNRTVCWLWFSGYPPASIESRNLNMDNSW